jgi:NAD+ kinase
MAEFDLPALREQSRALFGGSPLILQDRPMLRCTVHGPRDRSTEQPRPRDTSALAATLALNDAVVTAGPPYHMISLSLRIDGHPGPTVAGDGLIVSTPIGSTAYNVSAGGPIVAPDVGAMAITPIAAHSLSFRPVIVGGGSTIELIMETVNSGAARRGRGKAKAGERRAAGGGGTSLVLDGQVTARLEQHDRVLIRRFEHAVKFVRNPRGSYWATLINKMRWATPPATR